MMRHFLSSLAKNFAAIFSRKNLPWHLLAIVLTYILVASDLDWKFFVFARGLTVLGFFVPAVVLGTFLPLVIPLVLFLAFKKNNYLPAAITSAALLQAALLASLVSSLYKAFTGRVQPDLHNVIADTSHSFHFGLLNHGIFWGWPSSHTTIAFAMAITLCVLYAKNRKVVYLSLLYAFYVGAGVAIISIHWLSEAVAGAIIGSVIGMVVGKSFLKSLHKDS
jgi:membrane-associated phospholipid phosphatase